MANEFAGSLRVRIRVQRSASERDALGGASGERQLVAEFWAAAKAVGTGDAGQAESRAAMQRWEFTLRLTDAVLPGDHVLWNERTIVILTVANELGPVPKTILLAEEKR